MRRQAGHDAATIVLAGVASCLGACSIPAFPSGPASPPARVKDSLAHDPLPIEFYPTFRVDPALTNTVVSDADRISWRPADGSRAGALVVPLRSVSSKAIGVRYRVMWLDSDGRGVATTAWSDLDLPVSGSPEINATPPARADSWQIEIQRAR